MNETRASARVRDVKALCDAIQPSQAAPYVLGLASAESVAVMMPTTERQYLFWSQSGFSLTAAQAFCDVRLERGQVVSRKFFED